MGEENIPNLCEGDLNMAKINLTVATRIEKNGKARCPWITHGTVYIGDATTGIMVASLTLGGRAKEADFLRELKRNPGKFRKQKGWEMAQAMGLLMKQAA